MKIIKLDDVVNFDNKNIFIDNDLLGDFFHFPTFFDEFKNHLHVEFFIIDPIVEFEFLRDVFLPGQRKLKEEFISQDCFLPAPFRHEHFSQIHENALVFSKIYAHQKEKNHERNSASLTDLFLAGRIMLNYQTSYLATGNKKDFPSCIFDIQKIIICEDGLDKVKNYYLLSFSNDKFQKSYQDLEKMTKG